MHEIDLSKFNLRTDLIIEKNIENIDNNHYCEDDIDIDDITLGEDNNLGKKKGKYITISYKDITDNLNFNKVLNILVQELKKMLTYCSIKKNDKCLVIGLGNRNIISDALGSKSLYNIIVTRHLYLLGNVDQKYRNTCILEPNVMGITGIDSYEIIQNVVKDVKPDFIIAIDSLCAANIERLNKTIQITSTGITPGSGIGNNRKELSIDTLGVPVIAIGVPTVVDSSVIVVDTINYIMKKISYLKDNLNNNLDKLKPLNKINYQKTEKELSNDEKQQILGYIGLLDDDKLKKLVWEVLSPLEANMIVTTKEIDFIIEKLSKLISNAINNSIHDLNYEK